MTTEFIRLIIIKHLRIVITLRETIAGPPALGKLRRDQKREDKNTTKERKSVSAWKHKREKHKNNKLEAEKGTIRFTLVRSPWERQDEAGLKGVRVSLQIFAIPASLKGAVVLL